MQARKFANIRRRDDVREGHPDWTEGREQAAQIIERLISSGEWPVSLGELDDRTEWSRSHYRNTIQYLFEDDEEGKQVPSIESLTVDVPDSVTNVPDYLQGVAVGYNLCRQD